MPAPTLEYIHKHIVSIGIIAAKYGATDIRVFGSVANGTATKNSDIDFLVELEPGRSLFDLIGMKQELEAVLSFPVDVVTFASLPKRKRQAIIDSSVAA